MLNSPGRANRIDDAMAAELREVCSAIASDPDIGIVVLTGSGGVFSAGRETQPVDVATGGSKDLLTWIEGLQVASCVAELKVPVIAAINGDALDHGLELALAADLRVAVPAARFGLRDLGQGAFPWDGGTLRLPRVVGPAWAMDMILTGRLLCAAEALSVGLVNRITRDQDPLDEAYALAGAVMAGAPVAARYAKEAVGMGMELPLQQGLRLEADLNILLHSTSDRAEGIQSFLERREPHFRGC